MNILRSLRATTDHRRQTTVRNYTPNVRAVVGGQWSVVSGPSYGVDGPWSLHFFIPG